MTVFLKLSNCTKKTEVISQKKVMDAHIRRFMSQQKFTIEDGKLNLPKLITNFTDRDNNFDLLRQKDEFITKDIHFRDFLPFGVYIFQNAAYVNLPILAPFESMYKPTITQNNISQRPNNFNFKFIYNNLPDIPIFNPVVNFNQISETSATIDNTIIKTLKRRNPNDITANFEKLARATPSQNEAAGIYEYPLNQTIEDEEEEEPFTLNDFRQTQ